MEERYRVIVADPGWQFNDDLPGTKRGAKKHYETMPIDVIKQFPLPPLEKDATLFLWRVSSMVNEAMHVVQAWGFIPKTELIWLKKTKTGKRFFGMGRTVRGEHETCIIAHRGSPKTLDKTIRSTFEAKVGRHSEKPEAFYTIVEALRQGPYIELFARRKREGWACVGKEVE